MAIGAAGYIAVRILGDRFGLAVAGLASGFVSSIATIGAMGTRATTTPGILGAAVAAAVLSTVATIVQLCAVLAATSMTAAGTIDSAALRGSGGRGLRCGLHHQGPASGERN
jgi:uncharacterized membrane protein (DUF4010 family)